MSDSALMRTWSASSLCSRRTPMDSRRYLRESTRRHTGLSLITLSKASVTRGNGIGRSTCRWIACSTRLSIGSSKMRFCMLARERNNRLLNFTKRFSSLPASSRCWMTLTGRCASSTRSLLHGCMKGRRDAPQASSATSRRLLSLLQSWSTHGELDSLSPGLPTRKPSRCSIS